MMNSKSKLPLPQTNDEPRLFWLLEHSYPAHAQTTYYKQSQMSSRWVKTPRGLRWELFYSLIIVFVLAACSASQVPQPSQELECQQKSYPCSFAEVSKDVLERTDTLSDEVSAMLESGKSRR